TDASSTDASSTDASSTDASSTDTTSTDSSATETTSTESSSETVTTTTDDATDPTDISTTLPVVITTSTSAGFNTSSTSTSASSATTTTAAPLTTLATFTLQLEGIIGLDGAIGAVRLGFFQFAIDFTASTMALLEDGSVVDGAGLAFSVPSSRGLRKRQESAAGSRIFLIDPADADYETCVCSLSDANELNCDCDGLTGFQVGTTDPYVGILGIGDVDADGFVDFIPVVVIDEDNTSTTTTGTAGGDATLTAPVYSTGGPGAPSYTTEVVDQFTTYCPHPTTLTYASQTYVVTEATTLTVTNCPCTITKTVENGAVQTHPAGGNGGNGGADAGNGGAAGSGGNAAGNTGADNHAQGGDQAPPAYSAPASGNDNGAQAPPAGSGSQADAQPGASGSSNGNGAVQQIGDGQIQNPANGGAASPAGGAGGAASPAGGAAGAASPAGGAAGAASPAGGNSGASDANPSSSTPEVYQGAASSVQASFGFAVAMIAIAAF
ncbi:hypothetical protein TI39_contig504g00003, partial [Zymoseptoria brevis]